MSENTPSPTTPVAARKRAGLSTLALILVSVHWFGHTLMSGLATVYWLTPVLDWTDGPNGLFFAVTGGLGIVAFLIGLAYLGLGIFALSQSRKSGVGRARAGGAVALSAAYLIVMADSLIYSVLASANYGTPFLAELGLNP